MPPRKTMAMLMISGGAAGEQVAVVLAVTLFGGIICQEQGAVQGLSTSILCDFGRQEQAPFWIINQTVYEIFTIPRILPYIPIVDSYSTLQIPVVPLLLNSTTFQCGIFNGDPVNSVNLGTLTLLIVAPNPASGENGGFEDIELVVDFQHLFVYETSTSITWFANKSEACSRDYQIRGYTLPSTGPVLSSNHIFDVSNTTSYQLPSSQYISSAGEAIDYRLLSINDVCNGNRDAYYYRFNDSAVLESRVFNPNVSSTTCYTIPKTDNCKNSLIFYSENHGCPVHNSTQGRMVFQQCTRGYAHDMLVPELTETGEVCFLNLSSASIRNESLFHFLCSTDPCASVECLLRTVISSHIVIFASPPSTPNITYNSSFLCFSAYVHEEFPVLNFHVEITDVTGSGGSYNLSRQCLPSDNLCQPIEVSVTAINAIGTSLVSMVLQDKDNTSSDNLCKCYLRREPMEIDVTRIATDSATLSLFCGQTIISGSFNYVLENQNTNEHTNFTIECGGSVNQQNLSATTDYYILHEFDETECRVEKFTTPSDAPSQRGTGLTGTVIAILVIGVTTIISAVAIIAAIVIWKFRSYFHKKNMVRSESTVHFTRAEVSNSNPTESTT